MAPLRTYNGKKRQSVNGNPTAMYKESSFDRLVGIKHYNKDTIFETSSDMDQASFNSNTMKTPEGEKSCVEVEMVTKPLFFNNKPIKYCFDKYISSDDSPVPKEVSRNRKIKKNLKTGKNLKQLPTRTAKIKKITNFLASTPKNTLSHASPKLKTNCMLESPISIQNDNMNIGLQRRCSNDRLSSPRSSCDSLSGLDNESGYILEVGSYLNNSGESICKSTQLGLEHDSGRKVEPIVKSPDINKCENYYDCNKSISNKLRVENKNCVYPLSNNSIPLDKFIRPRKNSRYRSDSGTRNCQDYSCDLFCSTCNSSHSNYVSEHNNICECKNLAESFDHSHMCLDNSELVNKHSNVKTTELDQISDSLNCSNTSMFKGFSPINKLSNTKAEIIGKQCLLTTPESVKNYQDKECINLSFKNSVSHHESLVKQIHNDYFNERGDSPLLKEIKLHIDDTNLITTSKDFISVDCLKNTGKYIQPLVSFKSLSSLKNSIDVNDTNFLSEMVELNCLSDSPNSTGFKNIDLNFINDTIPCKRNIMTKRCIYSIKSGRKCWSLENILSGKQSMVSLEKAYMKTKGMSKSASYNDVSEIFRTESCLLSKSNEERYRRDAETIGGISDSQMIVKNWSIDHFGNNTFESPLLNSHDVSPTSISSQPMSAETKNVKQISVNAISKFEFVSLRKNHHMNKYEKNSSCLHSCNVCLPGKDFRNNTPFTNKIFCSQEFKNSNEQGFSVTSDKSTCSSKQLLISNLNSSKPQNSSCDSINNCKIYSDKEINHSEPEFGEYIPINGHMDIALRCTEKLNVTSNDNLLSEKVHFETSECETRNSSNIVPPLTSNCEALDDWNKYNPNSPCIQNMQCSENKFKTNNLISERKKTEGISYVAKNSNKTRSPSGHCKNMAGDFRNLTVIPSGKKYRRSMMRQSFIHNSTVQVGDREKHYESTVGIRNHQTFGKLSPNKIIKDLEPITEGLAVLHLNGIADESGGGGKQKSPKSAKQSQSLLHLTSNLEECFGENYYKESILKLCNQKDICDFEDIAGPNSFECCKKIGEGLFGEVFSFQKDNGMSVVLKLIPIEGDIIVNGEYQKSFDEIYSELMVSLTLNCLRHEDKEFRTEGFTELIKAWVVKGKYPGKLIELWQEFDDFKGSENDSPEIFQDDQLYLVLEVGNAGTDLESYCFTNASQAVSVFKQVACSLAVAEQKYEFEHRDLHWGNVLVSKTSQQLIDFTLRGQTYYVKATGVKATIIDYTLSSITVSNGNRVYSDIGKDPGMFTATGDYQFDVYRHMRDDLCNDWKLFMPKTNVRWLHYLITKLIKGVSYQRKTSKVHKENIKILTNLESWILECKSSVDVVRKIMQ